MRGPFPGATVALLGTTIVATVLDRTAWPSLFPAVRRDPDSFRNGEWWRAVSPILVQPDPVLVTLTVFITVGIACVLAERRLGHLWLVVLYLSGGVTAHVVGEWWQPWSSGVSVAGCGALGGLAVAWLREPDSQSRVRGGLVVALTVVLLTLHDIHGVGLATGLVLGVVASFVDRGDTFGRMHQIT
jgi:hypothetical protein